MNRVEMAGQRFGKLVVVGSAGSNARRRAVWACRCDCGGVAVMTGTELRRGTSTHCGCAHALLVDLTGQFFGRLRVLRRTGTDAKRHAMWACTCECGTQCVVSGADLRSGHTSSCGCLRTEMVVSLKLRHGMADTPEYGIWAGMVQRCTNPNRDNYIRYGGAGIAVDPMWLGPGGFDLFFAHIGPRPSAGHSIDRFPDRHGPYAPGNARWATAQEQADNTDRAEKKRRIA